MKVNVFVTELVWTAESVIGVRNDTRSREVRKNVKEASKTNKISTLNSASKY